MAAKIQYSMPRGDSRTFPIKVPVGTYSVGSKLFFALKSDVDNVLDDSSAVCKKTLTDANITSTDSKYVYYTLTLLPTDTTNITPDTYLAEIEFVSANGLTVITYPDPKKATWFFEITGDVNRRVT